MSDQSIYLKRTVDRLNNLNVDGVLFCQKVEEFKCLMAGSFPLQCYLDEYFDDSDVDVFCLESNNWFKNWITTTYPHIIATRSQYIINGVIETNKYHINAKACINVILVNADNLKEFVRTFDFTFCQTIFDGQTLECYYADLTALKIGHLVNQANQTDPKRTTKYMNRGFFISYVPMTIEQAQKFNKSSKETNEKLQLQISIMKDKLHKLMSYGLFIGGEITTSFRQLKLLLDDPDNKK